MIYKTVNSAYDFRDEFNRYGRGNQFTPWALDNLFYYLNESVDMELDVIGLCTEFVEVTETELDNDYFMNNLTLSEKIETLEEETTLVAHDFIDGEYHFLIRNF